MDFLPPIVILTSGVRRLADMDDIMAKSKVQLFGMSLPLLKDPGYLLSLKEGVGP